jgi:hypothetical protein
LCQENSGNHVCDNSAAAVSTLQNFSSP